MMEISSIFVLIFLAMLLGVITGAIAQSKGDSFMAWWLFGTLLFIIALPMVLIMPAKGAGRNSTRKICPYCQSKLASNVMKCPECKRSQPDVGAATVNSWERTVGGVDEVAKWAKEHPGEEK